MPGHRLSFESHIFVLKYLVLVVNLLRLAPVIVQGLALTLICHLRTGSLAIGILELSLVGPCLLHELSLLALQLLDLLLHDRDLGVENELLPFILEGLLSQVLEIFVVIATHLPVLCLEQANVLV